MIKSKAFGTICHRSFEINIKYSLKITYLFELTICMHTIQFLRKLIYGGMHRMKYASVSCPLLMYIGMQGYINDFLNYFIEN